MKRVALIFSLFVSFNAFGFENSPRSLIEQVQVGSFGSPSRPALVTYDGSSVKFCEVENSEMKLRLDYCQPRRSCVKKGMSKRMAMIMSMPYRSSS